MLAISIASPARAQPSAIDPREWLEQDVPESTWSSLVREHGAARLIQIAEDESESEVIRVRALDVLGEVFSPFEQPRIRAVACGDATPRIALAALVALYDPDARALADDLSQDPESDRGDRFALVRDA